MFNCWGLKKFLTHLFTMLSFFNSNNLCRYSATRLCCWTFFRPRLLFVGILTVVSKLFQISSSVLQFCTKINFQSTCFYPDGFGKKIST